MVGLWSVHNSSHLLLLLSHILPHSSIGTPWATDLLVLLVSLFQCGSSKGCSSFKEYPVLQCGLLHRLKCGYCSNRHLEHLLPLPLLWPWCSQSWFSQVFFFFLHSSLPLKHFSSILQHVSIEVPPPWLQGPAGPCHRTTGAIWNLLYLPWGSPSLFQTIWMFPPSCSAGQFHPKSCTKPHVLLPAVNDGWFLLLFALQLSSLTSIQRI